MGKVYDMVTEFRKKYPAGLVFRIKKHAKVVEDYLNPDEEAKYAFCAQKNEKITEILNSYVICLTNKRILLGHKRVVWGSFLSTITPDLYNDMQVYHGLFWGKITIDTVKETVVLTNISNKALDEIETTISEFMLEAKKKYQNEEERN